MIYTNWDPLKTVIVGNCYTEVPASWKLAGEARLLLNQILKETKEDLDTLDSLLSSLGVKVYRPKVYTQPDLIKFPSFNILMATNPVVPRDQYFAYDNTIYQTYTSMPDRYIDSLHYYEIFAELYEQGCNWISQPPPTLKNFDKNYKWYVNGKDLYAKEYKDKILWHTATMFKCGDAIITNNLGPGTQLGLDWMKRNCTANFIYNDNTVVDNWGHIDHGFYMTDDNTVFCINEQWVPSMLRNKRIVELQGLYEPFDYQSFIQKTHSVKDQTSLEWLQQWFLEWKGYAQDVAFETNVLVVDNHNVIFSTEQPEVFDRLKSLGITAHVCKQRHGMFWEAGIHCLTLDLARQGVRRSVI